MTVPINQCNTSNHWSLAIFTNTNHFTIQGDKHILTNVRYVIDGVIRSILLAGLVALIVRSCTIPPTTTASSSTLSTLVLACCSFIAIRLMVVLFSLSYIESRRIRGWRRLRIIWCTPITSSTPSSRTGWYRVKFHWCRNSHYCIGCHCQI